MGPIEQASYWLDTRPPQPVESLTGKIEADIAIIGAGFTGLWTAHFLRQLDPELDVVVLEQGVAGYGGSGRNAGIWPRSPAMNATLSGPASSMLRSPRRRSRPAG